MTDDITRRSNQYTSALGTLVLQSRIDSERYNTEPGRQGEILDPDHITGGGVVTSSEVRTSQTVSQQPSSRDYSKGLEIMEVPEYEHNSYRHNYSKSSIPHTTSHAEQRKIIFEHPTKRAALPNRANTLGQDYASFSMHHQGKLINKLQMDLERIRRDHHSSNEFAAPRSLHAQDLRNPMEGWRSGRSMIGEDTKLLFSP